MPKVLIAEPDEHIRAVLGESLQYSEWTWTEATTSEETIALARSGRPDIILIEPAMPGDVIAALRRLRAEPATHNLPFVVHAGSLDEACARHLRELRPRCILRKPTYPSEIIAELRAAL